MTALSWLELLLIAALLLWVQRLRREQQRDRAYLARQRVPPAAPDPFSPLFRALAEALDAGVIVVDAERTILYCNQPAAELFGVEVPDVLRHSVIALLRDYHAERMIEHAMRHHEPQSTTLKPLLSNRTIRIWCEPAIEQGALLVARDLTHVSQLERARRDMVVNVSHELRTPLASIKLLVETLATLPPPPLMQRMLGQVDHELSAVMQLVDELHDLSQIESGRMALQFRPTPVHEIIDRAVSRIEPQVNHKQIHLVTQIAPLLPLIEVDADRFSQVLLNLLHNAVKWTDSGGEITVSATLVPASEVERHAVPRATAAQWVRLAVADTGAGIPAAALSRIFERFYKVDRARTRGKGGTGLGLAIVKHLTEGHGGVAWATSVEGAGSTFAVALPVDDEAAT